jgi:hypothetical protein
VFSRTIKDELPVLFEKGNALAAVGVGSGAFGTTHEAIDAKVRRQQVKENIIDYVWGSTF